MQKVLIMLIIVYLVGTSSNNEEINLEVNTYQTYNIDLSADLSLWYDSDALNLYEFSTYEIEPQPSHNIEASLKKRSYNVINNSEKPPKHMKRAQELRELLFDIWRDKESSSLESENNVKVKYSYCGLFELKNRLIGHKNRHISYGRFQNTIRRINETREDEPSNSSKNIPYCTPTKKRKLNDDKGDLWNVQTDIMTNFEHEELMLKLREELMETVGHRARIKKANIMGVFYLLTRHLTFVAEPSPEMIADIKVITMEKFYEESKKYVELGALYFKDTDIIRKINILHNSCIKMFFRTRILAKCFLFPEFAIFYKLYKEVGPDLAKTKLHHRLVLIYVIDKFEVLFSSYIHLRLGPKNIENSYKHSKAMLHHHFLIRQVLFPQLLDVFRVNAAFITKFVFMAEL